MGRTKKATTAATTSNPVSYAMPAAPWIYINDPTPNLYVTTELRKLIPAAGWVSVTGGKPQELIHEPAVTTRSGIKIIVDVRNDEHTASKTDSIESLKASAVKAGVNFVTVKVDRLAMEPSKDDRSKAAHHLDVAAKLGAGKKIFNWLFTVLTIRETLHLISDADMRKTDTKLFPHYEYCPISQSRTRPKDAKIQFVAVILTKPQVVEGKQLVWTVADKTGVANFHFQHRDLYSQYTWDWVLSLKPGEVRALPRMPMVLVKERKRVTIIKAPFRATAATVNGAGFVLKQVGKGFCKLGNAVKLGPSSEWVPAVDVDANGKKIEHSRAENNPVKIVSEPKQQTNEAVNEKSGKTWDDGASVASTEAGSEVSDEKAKDLL